MNKSILTFVLIGIFILMFMSENVNALTMDNLRTITNQYTGRPDWIRTSNWSGEGLIVDNLTNYGNLQLRGYYDPIVVSDPTPSPTLTDHTELAGGILQITTTVPHGLIIGDLVKFTGWTWGSYFNYGGNARTFVVIDVPTTTTIEIPFNGGWISGNPTVVGTMALVDSNKFGEPEKTVDSAFTTGAGAFYMDKGNTYNLFSSPDSTKSTATFWANAGQTTPLMQGVSSAGQTTFGVYPDGTVLMTTGAKITTVGHTNQAFFQLGTGANPTVVSGYANLLLQTTLAGANITLNANDKIVIKDDTIIEEDLTAQEYYGNGSHLQEIDLERDIVLWMPFEAGSQTRDHSGEQNDGTVVNAVYNTTGGYDGFGAYEFDGTDDYMSIADDNSLDINEMTLSVWVRLNNLGDGGVLGKYDTITKYSYALWYQSSNLLFEVGDYNIFETKVSSSDLDTANKWYHLVGTYDKNNIRLYIDGVEVNSTAETRDVANSGNKICVGSVRYDCATFHSYNEVNDFFDGTIDEVLIFNRSLSAEEVKRLYESRKVETAFLDNITLGQQLIFKLGEYIDNLVDGWLRITGNLDVTGNIDVGKNFTLLNSTFEDLRFPVTTIKVGSTKPPAFDELNWTYNFDDTSEEQLYLVAQMPHARKSKTNLLGHFHWQPYSRDTDVVRWCIEYTWSNFTYAFTPLITICTNDYGNTNPSMHMISDDLIIDGTGMYDSAIIKARIYRDADDPADNYTGDAGLIEFDMHYEVNQLGSHTSLGDNIIV